MDMVCVAKEGVIYNPVTSPIKIINDGEYLRADGTSLGADDGIGVSAIMFLLQQDFQHGPIRAIFTVDEEQGMSGAKALDDKYLADAKYLINCDSEDFDVLTISSAGSVNIDAERRVKWHKPEHRFAYEFTIKRSAWRSFRRSYQQRLCQCCKSGGSGYIVYRQKNGNGTGKLQQL